MIKCTVKTVEKDYLSKHIEEVNAALKLKPHVRIGILNDSDKHGDTASVLDIATIHEFGAPGANIPERSFIRSTVDDKHNEIVSYIDELRWELYTGKDLSTFKALSKVGLLVQRFIKEKFRDNDWPALKHRTGTPLVDTGQLRNSISYEVKNET